MSSISEPPLSLSILAGVTEVSAAAQRICHRRAAVQLGFEDPAYLQLVHAVASDAQVARSATLQEGTSLTRDRQLEEEQTQVWATSSRQHFCPDDGLGHARTAVLSVEKLGAPASRHSQVPSELELTQPYEEHVHPNESSQQMLNSRSDDKTESALHSGRSFVLGAVSIHWQWFELAHWGRHFLLSGGRVLASP